MTYVWIVPLSIISPVYLCCCTLFVSVGFHLALRQDLLIVTPASLRSLNASDPPISVLRRKQIVIPLQPKL